MNSQGWHHGQSPSLIGTGFFLFPAQAPKNELDRSVKMYHPALADIPNLAKQGNLLPVWRELPADLETPVSVYLKLRGKGASFLLESVEKGEQLGRYSFLGIEPAGVLTARDGQVTLKNGTDLPIGQADADPLTTAKELLDSYRPIPVDGLPRFTGGLVGYVGYDAVRFFERAPLAKDPGLSLPDAVLMLADSLVIFDHVKHRLLVLTNAHLDGDPTAAYQAATQKVEAIVKRLQKPLGPMPAGANCSDTENGWQSNLKQAGFEAAVRVAKEYITAGDIFQVVLSQRLSRCTQVDPFAIYRALRMLNPSPYMFFLELPDGLKLIGSSPEMLVQLDGRRASVRPIAGTRPRGDTPSQDDALAEELMADPKERA